MHANGWRDALKYWGDLMLSEDADRELRLVARRALIRVGRYLDAAAENGEAPQFKEAERRNFEIEQ